MMTVKKIMVYALAGALSAVAASCSDDDNNNGNEPENPSEKYVWGTNGGLKSCDHLLFDANGGEAPNGSVIGNGDKEFVFTGKQTLKKGTYTLMGWVYVADGAQLTIEPGTVIRGDKKSMAALIVERGGKIIAQGTAKEPIVFTSNEPKGQRKPGDWGGVILCGKAHNNQKDDMQIEGGPRTHHGGSEDNDNSGVLSYVRIEFAGYPFQENKEINGLTLGSVGSGTTLDHIQVSYSNDDSFEWFGGTVSCKYLVAYKGWDDDFDTDNGFSGKVQFGLALRDPRIADTSQSNGFESDNCADGADADPHTTCVFSNITFVGPNGRDGFVNSMDYITAGSYNPNNGSALGKYQAAMQVRRSSRLSCFNSLAVGYPIGLIIDGEKGDTPDAAKAGKLKISNVWFAGMDVIGSDANKIYDDVLYDAVGKAVIDASQPSYSHTYFLAQDGNRNIADASELLLTDAAGAGAAYMPQAGSKLIGAASFGDALLNGVTPVNYVGAFGAGDTWMDGWTNFDPNNTDY